MCSDDFNVIRTNNYGQLLTKTSNSHVTVHRWSDIGKENRKGTGNEQWAEDEFGNTISERNWGTISGKGLGENGTENGIGKQDIGSRNSSGEMNIVNGWKTGKE